MGTYIAILAVAGIVNLIAFIWLVIVGFQRSVVWGILVFLFSPLSALIFAIMHWFDAKKPFLLYIVSTIAMIVPIGLMLSEMDTTQITQVMKAIESGEIKPNEAYEQYGKLDESTEGQLEPGAVPPPVDGAAFDQNAASQTTPSATESEIMAMADTQDSANTNNAATDVETKPDEAAETAAETSRYPSPGNIKPDPLVAKKKPTESPTIRIKLENIGSHKGRYFIITTKDGNQHRGLLNKVSDTTLFLSRKLYGGDFEYHVLKKKVERVDMLKEEYVKEFMEK